MNERLYRTLKYTAIVLTLAWVGWSFYDGFLAHTDPDDGAYHAGDRLFEDDQYERALAEYDEVLHVNPEHIHALRGRARSLLLLQRYPEALAAFKARHRLKLEEIAARGTFLDAEDISQFLDLSLPGLDVAW